MRPLEAVEWEACLLEPVRNRAAEREMRSQLGFVSPGARYFLDSPWLPRALVLLETTRAPGLHVRDPLDGYVALAVSQDQACRYCYAATRSALRILGFPEERIRRLEEGLLTDDLSRRSRPALDFARRVSRASPPVGRADVQPLLDAGWSGEAVRELSFFVVSHVFYNRLSTLPALPPGDVEDMQSRWYIRLMRPLIARRIASHGPPAAAEALTPERRRGPFSSIVNGLDGLPVAARLRDTIDAAWQSGVLPRRAKALIFAVVARGLGSLDAEREATQLLEAEGMSGAQIDELLRNLVAPGLEPTEAAVVPFARETVWYNPAQIQRRARALRERLTHEEFVDVIGIAALANAVCRLSGPLALTRSQG
jgi:AhpD family alkylhydroperoxidase